LIRFAERPAWSKKEEENTTGSRIMFDHIKNEGFCKREIKVDQISLGNLVKMKIYYGLWNCSPMIFFKTTYVQKYLSKN
jgi:hypothetical protein